MFIQHLKTVTPISSERGELMKRWFRELSFDLREPGINIWSMPIFSAFFIVGSILIQSELGVNNTVTLSVMEIMIPFMGGYASIMIMQGLLDTEGCEILYTYDRSYLYWGILRQLRLFLVQIVHSATVCGCIAVIMKESFVMLLILTIVQSFAVMSISFFGMAISKKVSVAIIILIAFVGIQITLGREMSFVNWIYVLSGSVPDNGMLISICVRSIFIGIFGFVIGQMWIRP